MSNNTLTILSGIDETIQGVQKHLFSELALIWSGDIDGYGRVSKNIQGGENIPEWFNASKLDYEEVYYNDEKSCVFCFLVGDTDSTEDEVLFVSDVKCVFMMDLSKVFPGITERQDATAQLDAANSLREIAYERYFISEVQRGIENVFLGYDTSKIGFNDIHPLHCFSINLKLNYYITEKCS